MPLLKDFDPDFEERMDEGNVHPMRPVTDTNEGKDKMFSGVQKLDDLSVRYAPKENIQHADDDDSDDKGDDVGEEEEDDDDEDEDTLFDSQYNKDWFDACGVGYYPVDHKVLYCHSCTCAHCSKKRDIYPWTHIRDNLKAYPCSLAKEDYNFCMEDGHLKRHVSESPSSMSNSRKRIK